MRTLIPLVTVVALAGCTPETGPPGSRVHVHVDPSITPTLESVPSYADGEPRPVAALMDQDGFQVPFVENELVVATDDETLVADIASRWGGEVVHTVDAQDGDRLPDLHVIRIDPALADAAGLVPDLEGLVDRAYGGIAFSSESGQGLFAAAAAEASDGHTTMVNWVASSSGYDDRVLTEAPLGPVGYDPNPFTWSYMDAGSTQDIGVGEAWRGLHLSGLMGNRVKAAVIDQGFVPNDDFPPADTRTVSFGVDAVGSRDWTFGGWHGTNVVEAGFGQVDNGYGIAGPGGPVTSEVLTIQYGAEITGILSAILLARSEGADLINMSFSIRVPTIVAWTLYPFEWATEDAWDDGLLVFAAAGNDGDDVDGEHKDLLGTSWGEKAWYAPCENNKVICVGGIAEDSRGWDSGSNWGHEHVDIWAPYGMYLGPDPDHADPSRVEWKRGTSFASPFVAGVAALVWAADPTMSNDAVWSRLRLTAHDSSDSKVRRIVNAEDAVLGMLDEGLPWVEITSPPEGSVWSAGWPIPLEGHAGDLEDGAITDILWSSDLDGLIGAGTATSVDDLQLGTHLIETAVFDQGGNIGFDQVEIEVVNDDPEVTLLEPLDGAEFVEGEVVTLRATSFDFNENPTMMLPDASLAWTSSLEGALGTGHELDVSLGQGLHTLTVTGTDAHGATASDSVSIDVIPGFDFGPVVTIHEPADDVITQEIDWQYDGYDPVAGMSYKDVLFIGSADDPEDGMLSGGSLVWTTDRTDAQPAVLGTGSPLTVRLYGPDPCGETHTITLTATDSYGNVRYATRILTLWAVC